MALAKRIIPCLDVDQGRVVKGVNFVGIRDAGDPVEIARRYNDAGADEITFLDITRPAISAENQAAPSSRSEIRMNSSAVCAWSIDPGPRQIEGSPAADK